MLRPLIVQLPSQQCVCLASIQAMCAALCWCFNLQIELQFGPVYDKYRYSCYYWECVVLMEAFLLALMLVMLQTLNSPALQVLVAMAIIFVEAVLHVSGGFRLSVDYLCQGLTEWASA